MKDQTFKTLRELAGQEGRVYVHLASEEHAKQFLLQAEQEGFTFRDGVKPTEREAAEVMALNPDHTINYVGAVGMMAFGSGIKTVGGKRLIRVEYTGGTTG